MSQAEEKSNALFLLLFLIIINKTTPLASQRTDSSPGPAAAGPQPGTTMGSQQCRGTP